jgi:hypothetical protein
MKYPQNQFEILLKSLSILNNYFDLKSFNPSNLHYFIYQQFSENQKHNHIYLFCDALIKRYSLENTQIEESKKLIDFDFEFELYPQNCNDSHIETAMNKALKLI